MDYRVVTAADVGVQVPNGPRPPGQAESGPARPEAEPARPGREHVSPPGRDATLLAVIPIPGTGTSLAIVGYVIATSAAPGPGQATGPQQALGPEQAPEPEQAPGPAQAPRPGRAPAPGYDAAPGSAPAPDDGLRLDHAQRRVWIDGRHVQLTFQEFELLAFLTAHPATVFTRAELVERVWKRSLGRDGRPMTRDSRTVDVHVSRVRHKLGLRYGQCLVTEYRVGYQFRPLAS
jgi:hypothetical protein